MQYLVGRLAAQPLAPTVLMAKCSKLLPITDPLVCESAMDVHVNGVNVGGKCRNGKYSTRKALYK